MFIETNLSSQKYLFSSNQVLPTIFLRSNDKFIDEICNKYVTKNATQFYHFR
jgi:hypothetical protein